MKEIKTRKYSHIKERHSNLGTRHIFCHPIEIIVAMPTDCTSCIITFVYFVKTRNYLRGRMTSFTSDMESKLAWHINFVDHRYVCLLIINLMTSG